MDLSRNKDGIASDGEISYTLPTNVGMLGMLYANRDMRDKSVYATDFYIYDGNGNKISKWFSMADGIKYWEAKLEDIKSLEMKMIKTYNYYKKHFNEKWMPAFDALVKVGGGHCIPTHKYTKFENLDHWKYRINNYDGKNSIGFEWCCKPVRMKNKKEATDFFKAEQRQEELIKRKNKFLTIFHLAMDNFIKDNYPISDNDVDKIIQFDINGRTYWYRCEYVEKGWLNWCRLSVSTVDHITL